MRAQSAVSQYKDRSLEALKSTLSLMYGVNGPEDVNGPEGVVDPTRPDNYQKTWEALEGLFNIAGNDNADNDDKFESFRLSAIKYYAHALAYSYELFANDEAKLKENISLCNKIFQQLIEKCNGESFSNIGNDKKQAQSFRALSFLAFKTYFNGQSISSDLSYQDIVYNDVYHSDEVTITGCGKASFVTVKTIGSDGADSVADKRIQRRVGHTGNESEGDIRNGKKYTFTISQSKVDALKKKVKSVWWPSTWPRNQVERAAFSVINQMIKAHEYNLSDLDLKLHPLVHCKSGKDRTGLVAAQVMHIIGETIGEPDGAQSGNNQVVSSSEVNLTMLTSSSPYSKDAVITLRNRQKVGMVIDLTGNRFFPQALNKCLDSTRWYDGMSEEACNLANAHPIISAQVKYKFMPVRCCGPYWRYFNPVVINKDYVDTIKLVNSSGPNSSRVIPNLKYALNRSLLGTFFKKVKSLFCISSHSGKFKDSSGKTPVQTEAQNKINKHDNEKVQKYIDDALNAAHDIVSAAKDTDAATAAAEAPAATNAATPSPGETACRPSPELDISPANTFKKPADHHDDGAVIKPTVGNSSLYNRACSDHKGDDNKVGSDLTKPLITPR